MATTRTHKSWTASASAPTLSTDGFGLTGMKAYRLIISADSGQTLSGGGTAVCWLYSSSLERWMLADDALNIDADVASVRDLPSGDFECPVGSGRVYFQDSSITKSSGTVTFTVEGQPR